MSRRLVAKLDHVDVHGLRHYLIYSGQTVVGRVFDRVPLAWAPPNATWSWAIQHPHELRRAKPHHGDAPTLEAALTAFRRCWDTASNPPPPKTQKSPASP